MSLHDTISARLAPVNCDHDSLSCPDVPGSTEENLAWRALHKWRQAGGEAPYLTLVIEKNIPSGGGLAVVPATLRPFCGILQTIAAKPLSTETLATIALELGSDVPFFLTGGCAIGDGRGELLTPITAPQRPLSLILPPFPCATPSVFRHLSSQDFSPANVSPRPDSKQVPENDLAAAAIRARYRS